MWGQFKARTRPAAGNHDYHTSGASAYFDYFGPAAGDPDEGYYSYDLGGWHVVVLNTNCDEVGGGLYAFGPTQPNSETRSDDTYGVLALTLHPDSYDWTFIPSAGGTFTDTGSAACVADPG